VRRLVAALACRAGGSRLYGKPLQNLDVKAGVSILEHQVDLLRSIPSIGETVLGVSEGRENLAFVDFAERKGLQYIVGDEHDVLSRLVACTKAVGGTDTFRITTESPFTYWERIDEAWEAHVGNGNDATVVDGAPVGTGFEMFTLGTLEVSHAAGDDRHRSELCSLYVREHRSDFAIQLLELDETVRRPEIRLTVDYPEDLVLCRASYEALKADAPRIPISEIISFLDSHPELLQLVAAYPSGTIWGPPGNAPSTRAR
jgi:spore coat polysaccharide biosynthesis protein SpsF